MNRILTVEGLKTVVELAHFDNLYAKLSFVVSGSREKFPCRDMFAMVRQIITAYTPQRCMWGSVFRLRCGSPG